jgi:hypothetical protein
VSWLSALHQDEVWTDKAGAKHLIIDMDGRYRHNCEALLLRNAKQTSRAYSLDLAFMPMPNGEMACDAIEAEIDREDAEIAADPVAWLREQRLLKALRSGCPERIWDQRLQPHGCADCGRPAREHGEWATRRGFHSWTAPEQWLIKARMRARQSGGEWGDPH